MIARLVRGTAFGLPLFGFALDLSAQDSTTDAAPLRWQRARAVWFVEGANPVGAEVCVGAEAAAWTDAVDAAFTNAAAGDRVPLGIAGWATLDTFTNLRCGDVKIGKGCYFLALERIEGGWSLALLEPARVQKARLLPAGAAREKPFACVPLREADGAPTPLGCELTATEQGTSQLHLRWGPHRFTATFEVAGAKGASPIAQHEPRGVSRIDLEPATEVRQGFALLDHGSPAWSDELAAAARQLPKGGRWRLGQNWWTTLETNRPLAIGGKKLAPGTWHLSLRKTGRESWALVCTSASTDVGALLDAFAVEQSKAGVEVPLSAGRMEQPVQTLQVACETRADGHRLRIAFGEQELTARIEPK